MVIAGPMRLRVRYQVVFSKLFLLYSMNAVGIKYHFFFIKLARTCHSTVVSSIYLLLPPSSRPFLILGFFFFLSFKMRDKL